MFAHLLNCNSLIGHLELLYYQLIFSITELIFVRKTSFYLISVKASSGLRKMFSQCYYNQNGVWENVCLTILDTHFPFCFDVITELWQRFLLSLLGDFGIFGRFSPIEDVSRCYCQHYG